MIKKKFLLLTMSALTAITLAACSDTEEKEDMNPADPDTHVQTNDEKDDDAGHGDMDHSSSGEVPKGLAEADSPTFEVGSQATITADHMPGMNGAKATIVGAYDTTVYALSFIPTTGGDPVENHKWVIHEELEDAGDMPLAAGDEAVIAADHMEGMDGATATIDTAEETTVYMVDFTTTDSGDEVVNHKWITESELSAE
ncbi:hypothetical protein GPDM_15464 [Planococcus donghaensis MPA1U2]|uniref:DUF1541 domain-containing protein n=1 Tax=Planococcus donghaensis MPA1U2 TaxID=933115 RepID=E7RKR8_9BACL|nr:YdhK family protein [Planococcus donghaensis]EGA88498.1 hypothetical protein GPDM_15464 [Planococcus donghaensis MPA1U2]